MRIFDSILCIAKVEQSLGTRHSENKSVTSLKLSLNEVQAAAPLTVYCTTASTSLSNSVSYMTVFFRNGVLYY